MRINVVIVLALALTSLNACAQSVHLQVRVHEEDGKPVEGAHVRGLFFNNQVLKKQDLASHRGITDSNGQVEVSGHEELYIDLIVKKDGYYESKKRHSVRGESGSNVDIILRQKRNPIAMYAKHFKGFVPKNLIKMGFDFKRGDWVQPYGKGITSDMYFFLDGYSNSFTDFAGELNISFVNELDGFVDLEYTNGLYSELKLPYEAPKSGYKKTKTLVRKRKGKGSSTIKENTLNRKNNFGYFLRINTVKNTKGEILQANYVKIGGEVIFDPRAEENGAASIEFTYYYNPIPNDRNLEFDPQKNLLRGLKPMERVSQP